MVGDTAANNTATDDNDLGLGRYFSGHKDLLIFVCLEAMSKTFIEDEEEHEDEYEAYVTLFRFVLVVVLVLVISPNIGSPASYNSYRRSGNDMIGTNFKSYAWVPIQLSMHSIPTSSCQYLIVLR
jgi:hypothetical protein